MWKITHWVKNYSLCVKIIHCVKLTLCVKLHIVCKTKHWVKKYSLCVKSHTVCEITHILQDSTGVPFTLNMEKNSSHFNIFTLTPLVALATNIRCAKTQVSFQDISWQCSVDNVANVNCIVLTVWPQALKFEFIVF